MEIKSALPYEESEGEHDEGNENNGERDPERSEDVVEDPQSEVAEPTTPPAPEKSVAGPVVKSSDMTLEKWGTLLLFSDDKGRMMVDTFCNDFQI